MYGQMFSLRRQCINIIAPALWPPDRTVHAISARKIIAYDTALQPIPKPIGRHRTAKRSSSTDQRTNCMPAIVVLSCPWRSRHSSRIRSKTSRSVCFLVLFRISSSASCCLLTNKFSAVYTDPPVSVSMSKPSTSSGTTACRLSPLCRTLSSISRAEFLVL